MILIPSLQAVLKEYALEIRGLKAEKKSFLVDTFQGKFVLKEVVNRERAIFISEILNFYQREGVREVQAPRISRKGEPFVELGNKVFLLLPWIDGKGLRVWTKCSNFQSMRLLNKLHLVGRDFKKFKSCETKECLAGLLMKWKAYLRVLEKGLLGDYQYLCQDRKIRGFLQTEISLGKEALKDLGELVNVLPEKEFSLPLGVCHGDYVDHNLIFKGRKLMGVVDFEYCHYGLELVDLSRYIKAFSDREGWSLEKTLSILQSYYDDREIGKVERILLKALLAFPRGRLFWLEYSKRGLEEERLVKRKFRRLIQGNLEKDKVLKQIFN